MCDDFAVDTPCVPCMTNAHDQCRVTQIGCDCSCRRATYGRLAEQAENLAVNIPTRDPGIDSAWLPLLAQLAAHLREVS